MKKSPRRIKCCCGGPWDRKQALMPLGDTIVFRLGKWYGYYDQHAVWNELYQSRLI